MKRKPNHITVCISTYKRPGMLRSLIGELRNQITENAFTYSLVIADNDAARTARPVVDAEKSDPGLAVEYYCEPEQNIALARNKAVQNATGEFVAFIDDDEIPDPAWLFNLHRALLESGTDGIMGPVLPRYEAPPPEWILKGRFHQKSSHHSGDLLKWTETRTSNVLLKGIIFDDPENLFDPAFGRGGEDVDFFKKITGKGFRFMWCREAPVYETIPAARCTRSYLLRRALLRGEMSFFYQRRLTSVLKSFVALPVYSLILPLAFVIGHHIFMNYLIRTCDHIGRLFSLMGLDVIKGKYVSE